MDAVNRLDLLLFAVSGYIAIVSLVKLMIGRRNALAAELRSELEAEQRRKETLEQQRKEEASRPARPGRVA